ncbi:MAG TPA: type II toxin-antitoxin system RatA family toxin [Burkholderiales bacterium]|nr:type II toxin-antitoxin system RatA family toxin [Burkholderiales bacterium]
MKNIARSAIVEHSAAEMYALVEDIEAYPDFLPWCSAAEVHERAPGRTRATLTVGVGGLRHAFTTLNQNRPGEAIDMHLVSGPFRKFEGRWRFVALAPDACRIEFSLEYEFASRVLGKVLSPLFDGMADSMVEAFVRRAAQV